MKYNKYLKELGVRRFDYFRFKHFGIKNEFERFKYGTNYHEMWNLDTVLACEIYTRLRHLHEKYNFVCNFSHDENYNYDNEKFEEHFKAVLWSFATIIQIYFDVVEDEYDFDTLNDENSQNNRVQRGLRIFANGFWGVGI